MTFLLRGVCSITLLQPRPSFGNMLGREAYKYCQPRSFFRTPYLGICYAQLSNGNFAESGFCKGTFSNQGKLTRYIQRKFPSKVKMLRLKGRHGLIRARLAGARLAKGDVLLFLDSHCECGQVGWPRLKLNLCCQNFFLDHQNCCCGFSSGFVSLIHHCITIWSFASDLDY